MKSLVEEASSIAKAIEKAWERAGKPQSFSVKVYETPEKNFFGFTKKSAKIGIFFEEENQKRSHDRNHNNKPQHQKPHNTYRNNDQGALDRDNRSQNKFQSRNDDDRKARHQSNQPRAEFNDTRQETTPREQRNHDNDRPNRSDSRNNKPGHSNNNRRPQQQDRSQRNGSRSSQDAEKQQPLVSNLHFTQENEPAAATPVVNPIVQAPQSPLTQPAPQVAPITQSQRKVLKVSGRMYIRPKTDDDSEKK